MMSNRRQTGLLPLLAVLAVSVRLLTPAGYMPASPDSGLLFELCPDGLPVEVVRALAGGGHQHHHHHGGAEADSTAHQCPVGHMLLAALAVDSGWAPEPEIDRPEFPIVRLATQFTRHVQTYESRAPPA